MIADIIEDEQNKNLSKMGRPPSNQIGQLYYDTECQSKVLMTLMQDHDVWRDRLMDI